MKKERTMTVYLVGARKDLDDFMHAADMFERFKALIVFHPVAITLVLKPKRPKYLIFRNCVKKMTGPENKSYRIVAMFVPGDDPKLAWRDPSVKTISTGYQWVMFDPYLAFWGYPGLTREPSAPSTPPHPSKPG